MNRALFEKPFKRGKKQRTFVDTMIANGVLLTCTLFGISYGLKAGMSAITHSELAIKYAHFVTLVSSKVFVVGPYLNLSGGILATVLVLSMMLLYLIPNKYSFKRSIYSYLLNGRVSSLIQDGMFLPALQVKIKRQGLKIEGATIKISLSSMSVDTLKIEQIARLFNGFLFKNLVITNTYTDDTMTNFVIELENTKIDYSLKVDLLSQLRIGIPYILFDQKFVSDLQTSPHIILSGSSGSGKTMTLIGIMEQLSQIPENEPDNLQSSLMFIDPKGELAFNLRKNLPQNTKFISNKIVTSLDVNWLKTIIDSMIELDELIYRRSQYIAEHGLNSYSETFGVASIVIDELMALRNSYESAVWNNKEDKLKYSIKHFDSLLESLVTKGRSAGVMVVISTISANANEVPTALRNSMGIKIAMRPTKDDIGFLFNGRNDLMRLQYGVGQGIISDYNHVPKKITMPLIKNKQRAIQELAKHFS